MEAYIVDWLNLLVRWLHLITGIAWIGASFYFVMLDNSLSPPKKPEDAKRGVFGELWAVHGGGFYNSQKYLTGPKGEPLSENLHWSKWEAYTTWLSGMGLLALIYWCGASSYLIDTSVMALTPAVGDGHQHRIHRRRLDRLRRAVPDARRTTRTLLAGAMLALVMAAAWALFHVFGARAAFVHVGAMIGTMMVANVFFHIIPGQKRMVADIRAGREPDPTPGIIGKQRSVHNTYFTLPVLFVDDQQSLSDDVQPSVRLARAGRDHAGRRADPAVLRAAAQGRTMWLLPALAVLLLVGVAVALAPAPVAPAAKGAQRHVRTGEDGARRALRRLPCGAADAAGIRAAAEGRRAGDPGADRGRMRRRSPRPSPTATCRSAT